MKVPSIVMGVTLLAGVALTAAQLVVPGRAGIVTPASLSPTPHPPVPGDLASMWLVPEQSGKLGSAMTNFVRGVRLLEEDGSAAAALPLVSDGALSTTPVADYARYYTGLALMKLDRYAEADRVFADLASRPIAGHLPEDAAFRLGRGARDAEGLQRRGRCLRTRWSRKTLAQPQVAWLRLGLAADLAGLPMRSVEALQRAYYDYPTSGRSRSRGRSARQAGCRPRGGVGAEGTGPRGNAVSGAPLERRAVRRTIASGRLSPAPIAIA